MTFDPTKPVQTRDGRKARIICTDASGAQPIVALITEPSGKENPYEFTKDGFYYVPAQQSKNDLINTPEQMIRWSNVYEDCTAGNFPHRQSADACSGESRIGILKLIYEGGKLVDHEYEKLK